jgi:TRAP-type transport system periplasmic protein
MLKAQPATIQLAELGQALATGTVENFLTSSASGVENKLYEQVKFFYPVNAWLPRNVVVISQKAFDALDRASQEALMKVALAAEQRGWQISEQKDAEFIKELGARGVKIQAPSEALRKELATIGEAMTADWIKTSGAEGQQIVEQFRKR